MMSVHNTNAVKRLPKPNLRGHCAASFKFHVGMALLFGGITGTLFKIFWCNARKRHYAEFYENYDAEGEENKIAALGLFQSVPVNTEEEEKKE